MKVEIFKKEYALYQSTLQKNSSEIALYDQMDYDVPSAKYPLFQKEKVFNDEKTFIENYGNPLYSVLKEHIMIVVERTDEKVAIKLFTGFKIRKPGLTWFKKSYNVQFVSVNLRTGNVYPGRILNYNKKRKKSSQIFCNNFNMSPLTDMAGAIKGVLTRFLEPDSSSVTFQAINKFINEVDNRHDMVLSASSRLFKFYLDKKQIKYPNNFSIFSLLFPNKDLKKFLKKNENKLVDSIMELYGVKGNKLKKALHEVKQYNFHLYHFAIKVFGEDWVNQEKHLINHLLECDSGIHLRPEIMEAFKNFLTPKEKKKCFRLFKYYASNYVVDSNTFSDHIRFYVELKFFGDTETIWTSDGSNSDDFHTEHLAWVEKLDYYKKGFYERIYPEIFHKKIEEFKYKEGEVEYFPVLLQNTSDYNDESSVQSNCVRTYIGKATSFIVSLRKGSSDSEDRLTMEYKIFRQDESDLVIIKSVQIRAKYNQEPDPIWQKPIELLNNKMFELGLDKKFETYSLKKTCNNGTMMNSGTHFEDGFLVWSYKPIDYVGTWYNFFI